MKIIDVLTREQIQHLRQASDVQGWLSVLTTWGLIAGAMAMVVVWPSWISIVFALVIIGGRQLGLAILMHECSHYSLFRTRRLNDIVGRWLIAAPVWQDLTRYREHHRRHHIYTNTDKDPDLGLVTAFPTSRKSVARKFARDLTGIAGVKRLIALVMMDLGFLSYTASVGVVRMKPAGKEIMRNFAARTMPVILTNGLMFSVLWLLGHPWLYLLWFGAYMTTFSLFVRIRSMAEHAAMPITPSQWENTRTTKARWYARLTVAPHHVNYHLEHHLLMTVPHYRLPEMHKLLREKQLLDSANYADGYGEVLRKMIKPAANSSM